MKILIACLATLFLFQSCRTKNQQSKELKSFFNKCDELNIVYCSKDTFAFKTIDTSTIQNFTELICGDNDSKLPTTNSTPVLQLVYKSKGAIFFTAYVFNHRDEKGVRSDYVDYTLQKKKCKHLLTYRTGIGISEIYAHKVDLEGNPWTNLDTTNFYNENIKNNH